MDIKQTVTPTPDCPFLGLKNDTRTSLAYANTANHCFHCQVPAIPRLDHQTAFCLTSNFIECSVFAQSEKLPFPGKLKQAVKRPEQQRLVWRTILLLLGLLLVAVLAWQVYLSISARQIATAQAAAPASIPSSTPTSPPPTSTPTSQPASATPSPTATSLPPQKHTLEVPVKVDGQEFIIHAVTTGEQMVLLARDYQTSVEAIQALNYQMSTSVWVGGAIVIAPDTLAIDPAVPAMAAYKVADAEISLQDLAVKLGVDLALLKRYTRCPDGCQLHSGDWVMLPYPRVVKK